MREERVRDRARVAAVGQEKPMARERGRKGESIGDARSAVSQQSRERTRGSVCDDEGNNEALPLPYPPFKTREMTE